MAQKKKKRLPARGKTERTWTIPRILLVIGYGAILVFLGVLVMMRQELRRVGIFGSDKPQVTTEPSTVAPRTETADAQRTQPRVSKQVPPAPGREFTAEEKQQLEDILRSRQ